MSADDRSQADRELLARLAAAEARAEAAEARAEAAERRHGRSPDEILRRAEEEAKDAREKNAKPDREGGRAPVGLEKDEFVWRKEDPLASDLPRVAFSSVEAWLDAVDPLDPADKPEFERLVAGIVKGARKAAERRAARERAIGRLARIKRLREPRPAWFKLQHAQTWAITEYTKNRADWVVTDPALSVELDGIQVAYLGALHKEEANPLFAWRAFRTARRAGLEVPAWVMEYFDGCADGLEGEVAKLTGKCVSTEEWLPGALGFTLGPGGKGALAKLKQAEDRLRIYQAFCRTEGIIADAKAREREQITDCPRCAKLRDACPLCSACPWCNGTFGDPPDRCPRCGGSGRWPRRLSKSPAELLAACEPTWPLSPWSDPSDRDALGSKQIAKIIKEIRELCGAFTCQV